jgi:hypothetical protein
MSKYSEKLRERIKKNQDSRGGSSGGGFLNLSDYENIEYFKPKEGRNYLYILPYIVSTNHHPQGYQKGEPDYLLDIFVHKRVGLGNESIICPKLNFKQPCPICEEIDNLKKDDPDSKVAGELKATRRVVYNVIDKREPEKGIQLFHTNHYHFESELLDASANSEQGEGLIPFADTEAGYIVKFRAVEETFNKIKFFRYKDFDFEKVDKEEMLAEDVVEQTYPLEALMVLRSYDEISAIFYGGGEPTKEEEEDVKPKKKDDKSASLFKKRKTEKTDEEIDEPSLPKEEEDQPRKRRERKTAKNECPHGHEFGSDCDKKEECKNCKSWEECADEYDSRKEKS